MQTVIVCAMLVACATLVAYARSFYARKLHDARRAGALAALDTLPTMRCTCGHLGTEHVIDPEHRPDSPGYCRVCGCQACDFAPPI